MTKARDLMTADATCIGAEETVLGAAKKMTQLGVGSLPICGRMRNSRVWSPTGTTW